MLCLLQESAEARKNPTVALTSDVQYGALAEPAQAVITAFGRASQAGGRRSSTARSSSDSATEAVIADVERILDEHRAARRQVGSSSGKPSGIPPRPGYKLPAGAGPSPARKGGALTPNKRPAMPRMKVVRSPRQSPRQSPSPGASPPQSTLDAKPDDASYLVAPPNNTPRTASPTPRAPQTSQPAAALSLLGPSVAPAERLAPANGNSGCDSSAPSSRRSTADHSSTDCDADDESAAATSWRGSANGNGPHNNNATSQALLRPAFRDYEAFAPGRVASAEAADGRVPSHAVVVTPSASDAGASDGEGARTGARLAQALALRSYAVPIITPSTSDLDSDAGYSSAVSARGVPHRAGLSLAQLGLGHAGGPVPASHELALSSPNVSDNEMDEARLLIPLARAWHAAGLPVETGQAPLALMQQQQQFGLRCVSDSALLDVSPTAASVEFPGEAGALANVSSSQMHQRRSSAPSGGIILLLHNLLGQTRQRHRVTSASGLALPPSPRGAGSGELVPVTGAPPPKPPGTFKLHDDIRAALAAEPTLLPLLSLLDKVRCRTRWQWNSRARRRVVLFHW